MLAQATVCEDFAKKTAVLLPIEGYSPPTRFDMSVWYVDGAACAFGILMFSPDGMDNGLLAAKAAYAEIDGGNRRYGLVPYYEGKLGISAAQMFFGVSFQLAKYLFCDVSDNPIPSPESVARRIRSAVLEYTESPQPPLIVRPKLAVLPPPQFRWPMSFGTLEPTFGAPCTNPLESAARELVSV